MRNLLWQRVKPKVDHAEHYDQRNQKNGHGDKHLVRLPGRRDEKRQVLLRKRMFGFGHVTPQYRSPIGIDFNTGSGRGQEGRA